MNICKSSGLSARTKSLREKFSSKRSFSELSFAAPSTSTSSLAASETGSSQTRSGSFRSPRSSRYRHAGQRPDSPLSSRMSRDKEITSEIIKVATGSASDYTSFLPEDAYCSALDINCQIDGEPRFPWQRDVAIQCDLIPAPFHHHHHHHRGNTPQILVDPDSPVAGGGKKSSFGSKTVNRVASFLDHHSSSSAHHKSASSVHQVPSATGVVVSASSVSPPVSVHPAASHLLFPTASNLRESSSTSVLPSGTTTTSAVVSSAAAVPHKKHSHFAGLRFWKSSNTLTPEEQALLQLQQQQQSSCSSSQLQPQQVKQKVRHKSSCNSPYKGNVMAKKSVLQRAVSFDSRGYSKLISNDSIQSLDQISRPNDSVIRSDPATRVAGTDNDHLYLVDTSQDDLLLSPSRSEITILPSRSVLIPPPPSTPESRVTSPLTEAHVQELGRTMRREDTADIMEMVDSLKYRRELFTKKQTNSAPDSFDNGSSPESPMSDIRSDQGFVTSPSRYHRHHRKNQSNQSHIFTFETMQKLFDLKMRAKASESVTMNPAIGGVIPPYPMITTSDHQTELSSVAASVATGTSGPGSGSYTKPSLLEIPSTASKYR